MYCLCNHLYMYCLCNHFYVSNPNALAILYNVMVMPITLLLNLNLNLREREALVLSLKAKHKVFWETPKAWCLSVDLKTSVKKMVTKWLRHICACWRSSEARPHQETAPTLWSLVWRWQTDPESEGGRPPLELPSCVYAHGGGGLGGCVTCKGLAKLPHCLG